MGSSTHQPFSGPAWELARKQYGVVARRQLLALGMSSQSIQHRLDTGRLHRVDRGVYAVGRPGLPRRGRWMAAVLGCGSGAVLSHRTAGALWGLCDAVAESIEISIPSASPRRRPDVHVYRRPKLPAVETVVHEAIPVTIPLRTLIDLGRILDAGRLERAVNEADRLELITPERLLASLDAHPGEWGVGPLRALLGDRVFRLTDSELERRFLGLVAEAGLPVPLTAQRVNGFKVDFHWPKLGLVVETDGLRYHRTPAQQARDRLRDQTHTAAGLTHLRFTHAQVHFEEKRVSKTLVITARRLGCRPGLAFGGRLTATAP